jgi:hypothetical protein
MRKLLVLISLLMCAGFSKAPPPAVLPVPTPAPSPVPTPMPTPVATATPKPTPVPVAAKLILPNMKPEWTEFLKSEFKSQFAKLDLAAGDMQRFCPKYESLGADGRLNAWVYLAHAVIKFESGVGSNGLYKTCSSMTESNGIDSIGFFQLSYGDKFCPRSKSEGSLCDPNVNISCAAKLFGHFVGNDKIVAAGGYVAYGAPSPKGLARYWSVLRVPDSKSKHRLAEIIALAKKAPGCI